MQIPNRAGFMFARCLVVVVVLIIVFAKASVDMFNAHFAEHNYMITAARRNRRLFVHRLQVLAFGLLNFLVGKFSFLIFEQAAIARSGNRNCF